MADATRQRIKRKPVGPAGLVTGPTLGLASGRLSDNPQDLQTVDISTKTAVLSLDEPPPYRYDDDDIRPVLPPRTTTVAASATIKSPDDLADLVASPLSIESADGFPGLDPSLGAVASPIDSLPDDASPSTPSSSKSKWQTALAETRHFATGLISHPTESTKHYTILRHSPAIVFYRGPTTSIVVTIFSDAAHPLPPDRTLWLQQRGFSGDTGLKLKALLGADGSWLDVTPAAEVRAADLPAAQERDWARDIWRAAKRSAKDKGGARAHVPRETHVVRIPAAATDGYFRLVLCAGGVLVPGPGGGKAAAADAGGGGGGGERTKRKVLCPSPVFRIASTSSDSSVVRGAKLRQMPLELGVKIGSMVANNTVGAYVAPVTDRFYGVVDKYRPGFVMQEAGTLAYSQSGLEGRVDAVGERVTQAREVGYDSIEGVTGHLDEVEVITPIGPEEGPEKPFPINFQGKVTQGTGQGQHTTGVPTANLAGVPDDITLRLKGVYFGWACVIPRKGTAPDTEISGDWHEALIGVGPSPYAAPAVVARNIVTVHLVHDFGGATFFDARMKVMAMGFLRPLNMSKTAGEEEVLETVTRDVALALASLAREHWGPEMTIQKARTAKSDRSFSDKYVDAREQLQKRVDAIPLHWAGVRSAGAALRDKAYGNGGYWVAR